MSSVEGFVGLAAAHCVFACSIVLMAWGFVLASGTVVFVSDTVAMGSTVIAVVPTGAWALDVFVAELFVLPFEIG